MLGKTFYHGTIKKYVSLFGVLFSNISIEKHDKEHNLVSLVKVPIKFAEKDKILIRDKEDPSYDRKIQISLPMMSFDMDPFIHDPDRHLPSINRISQANTTDPNHFNTVYVPVAYNIPFNLYVYVKNETDATKIIEQILPFFKPEYTVKANMLPGIDKEERNVPFFLTGGPNFTNLYEGPYTGDKQMIVVELNFLCHAYFWGPVEPTPIIKFVKVNEHFGNSNVVIGTSTMQPGLTANGEPTSNANNSVDPLTIYVTDDYGFAEDDDDQLF